jgi:hypothetical protein
LVTESAFKDRSRFSRRILNKYTNTNNSIKKFGDSSASFNGSGNYLIVSDSNNLNFGSDDFTVEFWMNLNSVPAQPDEFLPIPTMTSNSSPSGIVSASHTSPGWGNGNSPWLAFDKSTNSNNSAWSPSWFHWSDPAGERWIQYTFANNTKSLINQYTISAADGYGGYIPNTVYLYGSNDGGSTYDLLDTHNTSGSSFTRNLPNNAYYSTYKWGFSEQNILIGDISINYAVGSSLNVGILGKRATESNYAPYILELQNGKLKLYMSATGSSWTVNGLSTAKLSANTWYHVAFTRSGSTVRLFLDGVAVNETGTTSGALMTNFDPVYIGASSNSPSAASTVNGYIDDLRITKGIARYSDSFSKPIAPAPNLGLAPIAPSSPSGLAVTERDNVFKVSLTPPTSDGRSPITAYNFQYSEDGSTWNNTSVVSDPYYDKVSLLLPMTGPNNSTNIVDDSKHNHNVGLVGNVKIVSSESWFGNGSVVFDGTNDNLVINNNSVFDLTNQDWTIEAWIRPTGNWSKYNNIITKRGNGGSEGTECDFQLYLGINSGVLGFYNESVGVKESSVTPLANIWNHVAAVRNGSTITLYLNGISVLSFVANALYNTNRKVYVGGWPAANNGSDYFYGNMNDVRVTKGVARYTSNFDPRNLIQAPANRITGLSTLGTPYSFRARSVNSVGSSDYSSSTTSVISALGAPSNLHVITDDDRAFISWTAPTANNSAIKDYAIQYKPDGESTWTNYAHTPSIDTSIMVSGLLAGTSYSFQVAAINIAGTGSYVSTTSSVLTALRQDNTYNKTRLLLHLDSN